MSLRICPSCGAQNRIPASRLGQRGRCGACKTALTASSHPVEVDASSFDGVVLASKVPVLVDFWSPTCPPCRMVAPELEKVAKRRAGQLLVAKLDTSAEPRLAARFHIEAVPTLILFEAGREVRRVSGAMPAAQIEKTLGL